MAVEGLTSSPDIRTSSMENPSYLSSWLERAAHVPVDSDGQSRGSLSREPLRLTVACWGITMNQPSPMLWCHQNTKETLVLDKLPQEKKKKKFFFYTFRGRKVIGRKITAVAYYVLLYFCPYVPVTEVWQMCFKLAKLHFGLFFFTYCRSNLNYAWCNFWSN